MAAGRNRCTTKLLLPKDRSFISRLQSPQEPAQEISTVSGPLDLVLRVNGTDVLGRKDN